MLFSVDSKYELIYGAPGFEDILNCLRHGTVPSSFHNQEKYGFISEEDDVRSKQRSMFSASGPEEVTVSGSSDIRTDARNVKSNGGPPRRKKIKCTNQESFVRNKGSSAENYSSKDEITESCSPKNPSSGHLKLQKRSSCSRFRKMQSLPTYFRNQVRKIVRPTKVRQRHR